MSGFGRTEIESTEGIATSTALGRHLEVHTLGKAKTYLAGLLETAKPVLWLKTLALMLIAVTYATGTIPDVLQLLGAFVIVGPLLWGGLYALNDVTDIKDDSLHPIKRGRPLPSKRIAPKVVAIVSLGLVGIALALSAAINPLFSAVAIIMTVKQGLYTLPPFRFKERFPLDVLFGSTFNPTLRFLAGWFLISSRFDFPVLLLLVFEGLQVSGFVINRLYTNYSINLEATLGYSSLPTRIPTKTLRVAAICSAALSIPCLAFLSMNSILRIRVDRLGMLPIPSLLVLAFLLASAPSFLTAVERADRLSDREASLYYHAAYVFLFILALLLSAIVCLNA